MANLTRAERLKKYGLNNDGSVNEELQKQNADVLTRIGETFVDVGGNLAKSIGRGVEGLIEGVVGVAGGVGSIFGADTQWAEDIIAQTWTEDVFSGLPEATKNSYINELSEGGQETVRGIIDGVGQAATAIGLSFVNPAAAVAYMGTSAAGRSTEEALYDGANYTDALAYGTTQGVLESALEYVTGGVSRLAKIGGKQAIKSTGKLIAGEALQEAAQEGIQGAINPITKTIYKGSEALDEYNQEGFWQDVGKQALIGGISGSMGAGMGVGIQTAAAGGRKQFKVANASAQVQEALNETSKKVAKGKMSDTQLASAVDDINAMNDRLEGFVSKLSFEQQQKMFQPNGEKPAKYRVPQGFEWTDNGLVRTSKATEEDFNDIIKQGRASVSLLGREKEVSRLLERTGATIYRGELASDENANYNKVRKFHQALASKGIIRSNLILVDTMANAEAFNSGDIIVLGKDQLSSEAGVKKILHEVTHFAEETKEYKKFANFVLSLDGIKDINVRILNSSGYGVTQDVIDSAIKKFKIGKELTKAETTYISEAVAFSAETLLSDEATIERLCKTDRNLAQKILRKIKEFIKVISGRFNGDEQLLKDLRKAEKLYIKALAKSGTEYLVKQQKAAENKVDEEDVDSESKVQYAKKKQYYAQRDPKTVTQEEFEHHYWATANNYLNAEEMGQLKKAISNIKNGEYYTNTDGLYMIPIGTNGIENKIVFTNGFYESFTIESIVVINLDDEFDLDIKRSIIYACEREGIRTEADDVVEVYNAEDFSYIEYKRSLEEDLFNSNGEQDRTRSGGKTQLSLKDSTGNTLSQEQAEFFKDSKVRDENGNLLVLYHQTDADFTVFDTKREGAGRRDQEVPHGIFLKPTDADIGMKGKKQMPLYANIKNPLVFLSRSQANRYWKTNVPGYAELVKQLADNDTKYGKEFDDAFYGKRMSRQAYRELPSDEKARLEEEYEKESDRILKEWETENTKLEAKAKKLIDEYLLKSDYDGIHLQQDVGSFGRKVETYIALESNQVKDIDNKNPTSNEDIRFSLKENELDKFLEELSFEELMALVGEDVETVQSLPTKRERRDAYIRKLYEQGNLNKVVTDIVKSKPQMAEYFAKTQMNNKYNPLIKKDEFVVMFHGSPRDFNEFDAKKIGKHGTLMGSGIYFTDNLSYAEGYHEDGGRIFATLLKIEKPLSRSKVTFTKKQLGEFIQTVVDPEGDDYLSNYGDVSRLGYDKLLQNAVDELFAHNRNDAAIIEDIYVTSRMDFDEFHDGLTETMGYDGIIAWNKAEGTQAVVFKSNQAKDIFNFKPTEDLDIRYSHREGKIARGMSDAERYEILKDKVIKNVPVAKELTQEQLDNIGDISSWEDVNKYFGSKKRGIIKKIASEFGVFGKEYFNEDIELEFGFSKRNFEESYSKQKHDYTEYAKMFTVFSEVIENAIGIEIHNGNEFGYKPDITLKDVYVLVSAFKDGDNVVPVKLEVKEFLDKKNTLYVAIALESIKKDGISEQGNAKNGVTQNSPPSIIIISDLLKKINPQDASFYKYIPKQFFEELGEVRHSLKEDTRFKANHTQSKVYSREDAAKILNSIMESDYMGFDDSYADIKGHKYKVAEMLYRKMNSEKTEEREKVAYEIADYLIDNAAMQNIYVMDEQQEAMAVLEVLRPYLHNLNLDSIKSEIKYKYDDKSAAVHLLWGKKEGGLRVDAIPQELEEIGINVKAENQADIFFEIVDMYKSARNILNEKAKKLKNTLSTGELNETRDAIAKDILEAYDRYGRDSSLTKNENLIRKYKQKLAELKEKFRQYADRNHYETLILDACKKLKDKKNHRYKETSILADNVVTQFADVMGGIVARNQIRIDQMRERVLTLDEWYTEERLGMDFNWEVRFALEHLKATKKDANWTPTIEDYQAVNYVVRHVLKLCQTYEQITVKGQKMLVEDLATKGVDIIASGRNYRTGQGAGRKRFFDKVKDYFRKIVEPKVIFEQMESYNQEGVLTTLFDELAQAETRQKYLNIQLTQEMDDFFKKNKKFGKELKSMVKFKGEDITLDQALQLFLTAKRAEAKDSIFGEGGISFELNGRKQEIREIQPSDITELYNSFSDKAKEFIDIAHRLFNEKCRNAKVKADMDMLGFTNVGDQNDYIPIRREKFDFAKATSDARAYMQDLVSVYNFSFNKQITKNQHVIYLEGLSGVMQRHAHQVSVYAEMSMPLKTFDKVYTRQLEGGKSVRKAANKVWGGFDDYIRDFLCDMQSNFRQKSNPILNWFRNAYTKFQLGFNVKSILSQTAAFPMAYVYLDADVMAKGATMKLDVEALDKYSQYAYVRDYEKAIISANSMMDKVKGFGEISMKPMQKMDRAVIGRIWNACQLQVEKDSGLKVGTEENYVEAAKLLEKVGRGTQANYSATERSAMMRSESEFVRSFTMFTSDAAKQLSRIVEAMGKVTCFREKIKSGNYTEQELKEFNEAKKQLQKTVGAVAASTTWYVLISMAMKWLFAKKDEEGEELNYMEEFGMGYLDSFFGLFPIVRDVYSSFADGYEINVFYVDSANTLLDAAKKVATLGNKVVSNQPITTQEAMRTLRDVIYSLGQVTGIPTRNLYNQVFGLVSRFLPATGYKITSMFYSPYKSEMTKAIENGNVKMADAMMDRLLIDTSVKNTTKEQRTLYAELIKQGYDPLPRKVGETITYNEETVELTRTQRNEFVKIYSQATDKISAMMRSAEFNRLSAEEKAKAIKQIYDVYYGQAMRTVFAEYEGGKFEMASVSISAEKLAVYMAKIRSMESTLDKNGKPISGSKKQKVQNYVNSLKLSAAQKYMLMGLAGYKNKYGEQVVKSHINALKLSKTEKEKLLAYSGY